MQSWKNDAGKLRMDLLPFESVEAVAAVLTFGAQKYSEHTWQLVENAEDRYAAALLRHMSAHMKGERLDPDSGLSHLSHVACNAMFLIYFDEKKNNQKEEGNGVAK